jgi:hypothetical protein
MNYIADDDNYGQFLGQLCTFTRLVGRPGSHATDMSVSTSREISHILNILACGLNRIWEVYYKFL